MAPAEILIVDDCADMRSIIADTLQLLGAVTSEAANGALALGMLLDGALPDLIVLDYNMPVMNGPVLLAYMQHDERFANIPVIFFSASFAAEKLTRPNVFFVGKTEGIEQVAAVADAVLRDRALRRQS